MSMKRKLEIHLAYLDADIRGRVIDDVMVALMTPTTFMVEAGVHSLRQDSDKPIAVRAEWIFQAMILELQRGG